MSELTLTESEKNVILKRRAEEAERLAATENCKNTLRIASEYFTWLAENGRGSSFSTFVDEFYYQEDDSSIMYQQVMEVINVAKSTCNA